MGLGAKSAPPLRKEKKNRKEMILYKGCDFRVEVPDKVVEVYLFNLATKFSARLIGDYDENLAAQVYTMSVEETKELPVGLYNLELYSGVGKMLENRENYVKVVPTSQSN